MFSKLRSSTNIKDIMSHLSLIKQLNNYQNSGNSKYLNIIRQYHDTKVI